MARKRKAGTLWTRPLGGVLRKYILEVGTWALTMESSYTSFAD